MIRRIAATLFLVLSLGLAGAGVASAGTPGDDDIEISMTDAEIDFIKTYDGDDPVLLMLKEWVLGLED